MAVDKWSEKRLTGPLDRTSTRSQGTANGAALPPRHLASPFRWYGDQIEMAAKAGQRATEPVVVTSVATAAAVCFARGVRTLI
jgi:hypothetical protein